MATNNQASDDLLLAYAAGKLSPAPSLVVASHVAMSAQSEERLSMFESLGGNLLEEQPLAELHEDLFERMLMRLDIPDEQAVPDTAPHGNDHASLDMGVTLPTPLAARQIGNWRCIAPGIRFAKVEVPEDPDFKVVLLRVRAGQALPMHGHKGTELTLILKGSFHDEGGTYLPGDIAEEDEQSDHQPIAGPEGECICLTVIEGSMRPHGWLARMLQPLIGF
ncbi:ChrR family anti-sigma-E factor [Rhizobium setariae]|nr:ChrR family anti-sigma-E factor [Rhizobium setariae]